MIESCSIDRRKFLRVGALATVLVTGGCGEDGGPQQATTPPVAGGNRKRLKALEEKAEEANTKKK
jgi:hypothetical protein